MPRHPRILLLAAHGLLGLAAGPAWSQGQIEYFQASAPQVVAGALLWFDVGWRIEGSLTSGGSSNLVPPDPVEGYQEWVMNTYWTDSVTASGIDLQVGSAATSERLAVPNGQGASGSWGFALPFDAPGWVDLSVAGSFSVRQIRTIETELATRYCYPTGDPDQGVWLACDSWSYSYPVWLSESEVGGSLSSPSLQIQVLPAAVPEPAAAALWLASLAALGAWGRRRT